MGTARIGAESAVDGALHQPFGPGLNSVEGTGRTADASRWRARSSWSLVRGVAQITIASDIVAAVLACVLTGRSLLETLVFTIALTWLNAAGGLSRSRLNISVLDDLPQLLARWFIAVTLVPLIVPVLTLRLGSAEVEVRSLATFAVVSLALLLLGRFLAYAVIRVARRRRRVSHRTLIVGAGHVGRGIARVLQERTTYGLNPIGYVDANPREPDPAANQDGELPVLGAPRDLESIMLERDAHVVIFAFSAEREANMVKLIRTCDRLNAEIFIVPRLFELHHVEGDMDEVWGVPLVRLKRATHRSPMWRVKRGMDIVCSALALTVLSVPMALIALAVRLDGGPGVIFRQQRVGVDGRPVEVMKFRSMRPVNDAESQTNWNIANDKRVSKLGKFLRKTSLDELPQLINILRGDMSIVGPRPERPYFVEQFQAMYPSYDARHRVPCGLTGYAQVNGLRGDTSIAERARFDNYYIQNWSLWLDVRIIVRTIGSVFTGAGG